MLIYIYLYTYTKLDTTTRPHDLQWQAYAGALSSRRAEQAIPSRCDAPRVTLTIAVLSIACWQPQPLTQQLVDWRSSIPRSGLLVELRALIAELPASALDEPNPLGVNRGRELRKGA